MVKGVSAGWKKSLELHGVGYTAKLQGKNLVLAVGFSHDVTMLIPDAIKCTVTKNVIDLESNDRELLGTFAAKIRDVQPPEPYLGKGIKYSDETIRRKAGKTGKK
jgi:large subunit ribosomal protein L6